MNATFTDEQVSEILGYLERWMNAAGLNQTQAARAVGIGANQLSTLRGGGYSGDRDGQLAKIQQFLDREAERAAAPGLEKFVLTSVASKILKCCRMNHVHGTIGLAIGAAGWGKTTAFREYALRTAGVYRVSGAKWIRTPRQLGQAIMSCMLKEKDRRDGTFKDIAEQLVSEIRGQSALLVIDQAHQLTEDMHEFVQNLWDAMNDGSRSDQRFGVVLGATKRLTNTINHQAKAYIFEQLKSRIDLGYTIELDERFTLEDIKLLFSPENVAYTLPPASLKMLLDESNRPGGLRRSVAMVQHVQEIYVRQKKPAQTELDVRALEQVKQLMFRRAA